jgi:hypothetical protein
MISYTWGSCRVTLRAEVAELADAQASGACGRKVVEVRVLSSAPAFAQPRSDLVLGRATARQAQSPSIEFERRLSRRSCGRKAARRTTVKADHTHARLRLTRSWQAGGVSGCARSHFTSRSLMGSQRCVRGRESNGALSERREPKGGRDGGYLRMRRDGSQRLTRNARGPLTASSNRSNETVSPTCRSLRSTPACMSDRWKKTGG